MNTGKHDMSSGGGIKTKDQQLKHSAGVCDNLNLQNIMQPYSNNSNKIR